jgi:guanylate kinase
MLMPTLTTRQMRIGEVEGDPFFYLTKEAFQSKIENNELFEHECIHGNYYGSSKTIFHECLQGGNILMKDIGVEGALNLATILKEHTNVIKVFLATKNKQVLIKRLKGRGEKEIKKRLKRYPYEQAQKKKFDFLILNKNKMQTVALLNEIILNQNKLENVQFTKPVHQLNHKKINALVERYQTENEIRAVVKVCLQNGKIVLQNKEEQFIASLITNKTITKKVIEKNCKKPRNEMEQQHWKTYLNFITK